MLKQYVTKPMTPGALRSRTVVPVQYCSLRFLSQHSALHFAFQDFNPMRKIEMHPLNREAIAVFAIFMCFKNQAGLFFAKIGK